MIDVKRSPQPPTSLLSRTTWRADDVICLLYDDFLGKCYLSETPVAPGCFEVDHRHPKGDGGDPYNWNNLYPCHRDVNARRPKKWPEGGLLHPDGRDSVERRLEQTIEFEGEKLVCVFRARDPVDKPADNTAKELMHIHNEPSMKAADLRAQINTRLSQMLLKERDVCDARANLPADDPRRRQLEDAFRRFVSRQSPYAALIRSQVHPKLSDLLE